MDFQNTINEKLSSIEDKLSNLNHPKVSQNKEHQMDKIENNIFFELNNQLKPLTNNAVLVINKKQSKIRVPLVNKIIYVIFSFFIYLFIVRIYIFNN